LLNSATIYLGGVAPYHWLDFINNRALYAGADVGNVTQATGYSFTRASDGYYTNSDGTLTLFGSGALRRGDRGVLIEGSRTNLLLRSQEFDNASWVKEAGGSGIAASVTANHAAAPDGTTTADRVQFSLAGATTSSDFSRLRQVATAAAGQSYSFWARSTDGVSSYNMTAGDADGVGAFQFTVTGTWQRFVRSTAGGGGAVSYTLGLRGAQSPTNSNTADVLIWGAQLEAASFPSSYIPTVAAAATRAGDSLSFTAGLSYPLSMWAQFESPVLMAAQQYIFLVAASGGGAGQDASGLYLDSSNQARLISWSGSTLQGNPNAGTITAATQQKLAARVTTNDLQAARNGSLATVDTSATNPAAPATIQLGGALGGSFLYISRLAFFNSALADAQLQTVTGP
jgi:hypothetical protein